MTPKSNDKAQRRLAKTFPEATKEEVREASALTASTHRTFLNGGSGVAVPKNSFYREKNEGRAKPTSPLRTKIKLTTQIWNQIALTFFLHSIHESKLNWFIILNKPSRTLSKEDQLEIFLAPSETEYTIRINRNHRHLIIENLHGNPP